MPTAAYDEMRMADGSVRSHYQPFADWLNRTGEERIVGNAQYRPEMIGVQVAAGIYSHIAGVDLVRAGEGEYYVLEDNLRVPSGVSYMLENRKMMMRLFPELFATQRIRPVQHYPDLLLANLYGLAPAGEERP